MTDYDEIARKLHPDAIERQSLAASVSLRQAIAEALRNAHAAGVAEERERCARVADGTPLAASLALLGDDIDDDVYAEYTAEITVRDNIAAAIRSGK